MLVLSRKKNERIIVNGNIVITLVEMRGDKARIGIDAPDDVSIHREEVAEKIANQAAEQSQSQVACVPTTTPRQEAA